MSAPEKVLAKERRANRLINEKSPYLLQHIYNPVDWYPWSEEAFKKAAQEDKPIFLSIGYSTCHWSHDGKRRTINWFVKIVLIMVKRVVDFYIKEYTIKI